MSEVDNLKARYHKYLQVSKDSSKSGTIISPEGWFEAVEWCLMYIDQLEYEAGARDTYTKSLERRIKSFQA